MAESLVTSDQAKSFIPNYVDKGTDNDLIDQLIASVSAIFINYCGIEQFQSKSYTEIHSGEGSNLIFPYQYPITAISEINIDSDWAFGESTKLPNTLSYTIVDKRYIALRDDIFTTGIQNVKIVYTAGYDAIPADIILAACKEVGREFQRKGEADITNRSLNDGSVSFEKGLMKSTVEILKSYCKPMVY